MRRSDAATVEQVRYGSDELVDGHPTAGIDVKGGAQTYGKVLEKYPQPENVLVDGDQTIPVAVTNASLSANGTDLCDRDNCQQEQSETSRDESAVWKSTRPTEAADIIEDTLRQT